MARLFPDVAYAWRRLWRAPAFSLIAIATLSLGVGVNTALFSLVNGVLFKPLPVANLDRLTLITRIDRTTGRDLLAISNDDLRALVSSGAQIFDQFVLTDPLVGSLSNGTQASVISGELVSGNYFATLGVRPRIGRLLEPTDDHDRGNDTPVVISERLWRRMFGADPAVVGRPASMAGYPLTVVGVVPNSFKGTWLPTILAVDVWLPVRLAAHVITVQGPSVRTMHRVLATRRPGVSLARARTAVETIARFIAANGSTGELTVLPGRSGMVPAEFDHYGELLGTIFLALSGLVLLIASANLTNLLLVRGSSRSAEIAVRVAIGASRARIVKLLLVETTFLTAIGGLTGLGVAFTLTRLMTAIPLPALDGIAIRFNPSPDVRVFAYALLMSGLAAVAVGLVPARRAVSAPTMRSLVAGGGNGGSSRPVRGLMSRLVLVQVAISTVLLVGAGLYVRSSLATLDFDPGYDTSHEALASANLSMNKLDEANGRLALDRMLWAARQVPGVQHASLASALPAIGASPIASLFVGDEVPSSGGGTLSRYAVVSPGLFAALRIRLQHGRDFSDNDGPRSEPVAIVSEGAADKLWPESDPIGQRLTVREEGLAPKLVTVTVIGVSANTATSLQGVGTGLFIFMPASQQYSPRMTVVVRTASDPTAVLGPLERALGAANPGVAILNVQTLADAVGFLLMPIRLAAMILVVLGSLGFAIAVLGVYGMVAYYVSQQTRELGVRRALGASAGQIYRIVLGESLRRFGLGAVAGIGISAVGASFLRHLLYGIDAHDPITFSVVPTTLIVATLAASLIPARRAARIDPSAALKEL